MCSYIHGKETSADIYMIRSYSYMIRSITWFAKITIMIQDCRISLMKLEIKLVSTQSHGKPHLVNFLRDLQHIFPMPQKLQMWRRQCPDGI